MTQEIITITVEAGQMTARRKSRKIAQRRPVPVWAIVKYAALTIAGIMLFREGAARALAYRGYFAVGGEVFALFLPIFYYCLSRTVRDLITDIKNGFKPEYEEDYSMGHCFSHLQLTDRRKIEYGLNRGDTPKQIAAELHVHVSTIYREIKRARWEHLDGDTWIMEDRYNPDGAEKRYRENLAAKGAPLKIGNDHELADYLERKVIEEDRSPAAALADITIEGRTFKTSICVSTFYGYIEKGVFLNLTNKDLPEKPKRKRPYHKVKTTKRAPRGESIEKRPEVINQRITFGHWEMDTVYSGKDGSCALLVLTERLSRKEIIEKMRDRTAISTVRALNRIERRFGALFPRVFQTITVDNGGEFSDVKSLERSILRKGRRTKMYYCHPYTSCERGSNECANKMIRRKFPKGTDFNKVSRSEVKKAEEWMNNYPREILGWKTAEIVFAECLEELAREA